MNTLTDLQQTLSGELQRLALARHPDNLYAPIRYILTLGGKRIRPLLVLLGVDVFDSDQVEKAMPAAVAVELFHNFTLMHDDIMDNAPLRRGKETVHERWDSNTAILSGDNLLILAYQQLSKCDPTVLPSLLHTFNQTAQEVCEGQQLDMDFEQRDDVSIAEYIEMIRLKTSVLLGGALKLGAIIGGASVADASALYDFGVNVGIAFQLQDDILDVFGDPKAVGKQIGGDILANKKTYLLIKSYELADDKVKAALDHWVAQESFDPKEKISAVKTIYHQLDVLEKARGQQQVYSRKAFEALGRVSMAEERKQNLYALSAQLLARAH